MSFERPVGLNSVLVGAIVALLALQLGATTGLAVLFAVVGFVAAMVGFVGYARAQIEGARTGFEPRFPSVPPRA